MSIFSDLKLAAKLGRRQLRRARQALRYGPKALADTPIMFGNSFPKSGTHLLTQVLTGFSALGPVVDSGLPAILTFDGPTGTPRPAAAIRRELARLHPGDVAYGHLHATPEAVDALCRDGVAPYFILRDPRDVVVSHVFYVAEKAPNHVHHDYYRHTLKDFDERLRVSMLGRPELDIPFPDIRERFAPYMPWLERPEVLLLRFEDFITQPRQTLDCVFDHAIQRGFTCNVAREQAIEVLLARIQPQNSPTFRSGKVGGWKEHFSEAHKTLFKEVSGDLLVRLGYAENADW